MSFFSSMSGPQPRSRFGDLKHLLSATSMGGRSSQHSSQGSTAAALPVHPSLVTKLRLRLLRRNPAEQRQEGFHEVDQQAPPSKFVELPVELIVEVLRNLDGKDIKMVKLVCQGLRDIVQGSALLQYMIKLHSLGMVEGPSITSLPLSARATELQQWQDTLREFRWRKVFEKQLDTTWVYLPYSGERVFYRVDRITGTIDLISAGSSAFNPSIPFFTTIPWPLKTFHPRFSEMYHDSAQQLMVLKHFIESQGNRIYYLLFVHHSGGYVYPGIEKPYIPISFVEDKGRLDRLDVGIRGEFLVIRRQLEPAGKDIMILNWKRSSPPIVIRDDGVYGFPERISFLDADHLVGVMPASSSLPAAVVVFPWRTLAAAQHTFSTVIQHATVFLLPRPAWGMTYRTMWYEHSGMRLHCNSSSRYGSSGPDCRPFSAAPDQPPLVMLKLTIAPRRKEDDWDKFNFKEMEDLFFLIPGRTLMSRIIAQRSHPHKGRPFVVPWNNWGDDTRVWPLSSSTMSLLSASVYDNRLYWLDDEHGHPAKIVVFDFSCVESLNHDVFARSESSVEVVVEPSCLSQTAQKFFKHAIVTQAPYHRYEWELEEKPEPGCHTWFGENCALFYHGTRNRISILSL